MGNEPGKAGFVEDGEGALLQRIWREVEGRGESDAPQRTRAASPSPASDATEPGGPEHERLLQSARAVHALNARLNLDMETPAHRLARDRMTAFVAKVSALSGVRPDELVIGSGSDAFVVQNDVAGRTIARFDTQDAVKVPVGESLARLAAASRDPAVQAVDEQALEQQPQRSPLLP